MAVPLAQVDDVAAIWRPIAAGEIARVAHLIDVASAKLRARLPFDIDARTALYAVDPLDPIALDPVVVANVVAAIVKRVLVNPEGLASTTQSVGPYSESRTFSGKAESEARGEIYVTEDDVCELLPKQPFRSVRSLSVGLTDAMARPARWPRRLPYWPGEGPI